MQQPYYCNIDQQNGTTCFDLRGVNISFVTLSAKCSNLRMGYTACSDEGNVLKLIQWTKNNDIEMYVCVSVHLI